MTLTQKIAEKCGIETSNSKEQVDAFKNYIEPAMIHIAKYAYFHGISVAMDLDDESPQDEFTRWINQK